MFTMTNGNQPTTAVQIKIDTLQIAIHRLQFKIDSLHESSGKLHLSIDSIHKSLHDFGIASTYYHDIINTDITTFVGLVGVLVTLIALISWGTFILPLRRRVRLLNQRVNANDTAISNLQNLNGGINTRLETLTDTMGSQKEELDKKIEDQQKVLDFIASLQTSGKVSIKLISNTGEEAQAAGAIQGEEMSQPVGLPCDITLQYGNYTVLIRKYGYTMNPEVLPFQVNKMFTTIDIPVVKSPPMEPPAAEAAPAAV